MLLKRDKMSFEKGMVPWNKGRKATPKERARLKKIGFQKGSQPHNKGNMAVSKVTTVPQQKTMGIFESVWAMLFE